MKLITYPDNGLRKKSTPVSEINDRVRDTLNRMLETMYEGDGIGLAAPQIGICQRMFVVDVHDGKAPLFFVNPTITRASEEKSATREGCLSLPGAWGNVTRPIRVMIQYQDFSGKKSEMMCSGILATVVQHESDHLDGVMHIDRMESYSKRLALQGAWEARISRSGKKP